MIYIDRLGRELEVGDICLRLISSGGGRWGSKPAFTIVEVLEFRPVTVKIGERVYVDSSKLIKLTTDDLDLDRYLNKKLST